MKILFFDDNPRRHQIFASNTIGATVYHAYNISEAINCLSNRLNEFDYIFLDYDMHDVLEHLGTVEGTGMEVALHLIDRYKAGFQRKAKIVIHSFNTICSMDMLERLQDVGYDVIYSKGAFERAFYINGEMVVTNKFEILENE